DALAARLAFAHRTWPALRLSVTLATHAASDGSGRNLNSTGDTVLAALQRHGVAEAVVVNLMVMNYGPADARWCVVKAGRCDMGASALQAARNLHEQRGVPSARIALTLRPGENDVAGNVSTPDDARTLMAGARALGLAGVHFWSVDRDQACPAGEPRVSPRCHALPDVPAGAFSRLLSH
ncbi:MAG: glycosyl hydrolase, partial [Inhella sp.]